MTTSEVATKLQNLRTRYSRLAVVVLAQAGDLPGVPLEAKLGAVHELDILKWTERVKSYRARRPGCSWQEAAEKIV